MLNKVIEIVKEASLIMLDDKAFETYEKGSLTNVVTTNDLKVQNFLQKELGKLVPNCGFYLEEGDVKDTSKEYIWIVDPIDGTMNYSRHIGICCISVGLEYKGEIILGVVYNPYNKELYYAEKGKGAYFNGKRVYTSKRSFDEAILYTGFGQYDKTMSETLFRVLHKIYYSINDLRRTGSAAIELASLGAGKGDLYFEMKLQPYDCAGASIIITEAGGYIGNLEGDIKYDGPTLCIAANNKENFLKLKQFLKDNI